MATTARQSGSKEVLQPYWSRNVKAHPQNPGTASGPSSSSALRRSGPSGPPTKSLPPRSMSRSCPAFFIPAPEIARKTRQSTGDRYPARLATYSAARSTPVGSPSDPAYKPADKMQLFRPPERTRQAAFQDKVSAVCKGSDLQELLSAYKTALESTTPLGKQPFVVSTTDLEKIRKRIRYVLRHQLQTAMKRDDLPALIESLEAVDNNRLLNIVATMGEVQQGWAFYQLRVAMRRVEDFSVARERGERFETLEEDDALQALDAARKKALRMQASGRAAVTLAVLANDAEVLLLMERTPLASASGSLDNSDLSALRGPCDGGRGGFDGSKQMTCSERSARRKTSSTTQVESADFADERFSSSYSSVVQEDHRANDSPYDVSVGTIVGFDDSESMSSPSPSSLSLRGTSPVAEQEEAIAVVREALDLQVRELIISGSMEALEKAVGQARDQGYSSEVLDHAEGLVVRRREAERAVRDAMGRDDLMLLVRALDAVDNLGLSSEAISAARSYLKSKGGRLVAYEQVRQRELEDITQTIQDVASQLSRTEQQVCEARPLEKPILRSFEVLSDAIACRSPRALRAAILQARDAASRSPKIRKTIATAEVVLATEERRVFLASLQAQFDAIVESKPLTFKPGKDSLAGPDFSAVHELRAAIRSCPDDIGIAIHVHQKCFPAHSARTPCSQGHRGLTGDRARALVHLLKAPDSQRSFTATGWGCQHCEVGSQWLVRIVLQAEGPVVQT